MEQTKLKISFLGGAGTVTGSKTLIEAGSKKVIVDCGLFQGLKELRKHNWEDFPVDPESIDEVILTHAHLDHCGYLPLLVKNGFKGPIHCSLPTKRLCEIILLDSAKIQEEDAERANTHGYTKHKKALPLYGVNDVYECLKLFTYHELHEWVILGNSLKFQFLNNGHILGSCFVDLRFNAKKIFFSGDIGRPLPRLLYPPKKIQETDILIMESTYGDRTHEIDDAKDELLKVIMETWNRKGILMIPSFAVERTQELLYLLYLLREEDKLPAMPVYLDSPMGVKSTHVYNEYPEWQNISHFNLNRMYDHVTFVSSAEQSRKVVQNVKPKIVIAGSGMMEGGRILHYLNNHLEEEKNTLLFVGFQGEGTRGRAILEGAKEIKFFGEYRKVRCQVKEITSLSAHADQMEMIEWMRNIEKAPTHVFLNHGEPHQTDALRQKIEYELGWTAIIPKMNESFVV
ncbi:MAG: MBL fold metallo-hydrolase [Cryomorphaceae bacterium]|jgi:metallo-beta-lactamase family protein|nr:MBL fold metallo-hydrolase [Cryomorphaceae bacterium]